MGEVPADPVGLVAAVQASWQRPLHRHVGANDQPAARHLYAADPAQRHLALLLLLDDPPPPDGAHAGDWAEVVRTLLQLDDRQLMAADLTWICGRLAKLDRRLTLPLPALTAAVEYAREAGLLDDAARRSVRALVARRTQTGHRPSDMDVALLANAAEGPKHLKLNPGDPWADAVIADVTALPDPPRAAWATLIDHAARSPRGKPNNEWIAAARGRVAALGVDEVSARLAAWLPRVALPRRPDADQPDDRGWSTDALNADVLKGLAWTAAYAPTPAVARALALLCVAAVRRLPGVGARLPAVADAAVRSLGEMATEAAAGQLAYLRSTVTSQRTLIQIEQAMNRVAQRLKLSRDDLAELAVPACGFGPGGVRSDVLGPARVDQVVAGGRVVTTWTGADGVASDVPPAGVLADQRAWVDEVNGHAADARSVLVAQRNRLDGLMADARRWTLADWRPRYLEHPLVGTLTRRLIWTVDGVAVRFDTDGTPTDVSGAPVELPNDAAEVSLWHPAGRSADDVAAWRQRLEDAGVTQPFKQAHREVYLLTDAERHTRTYSNRFAGHVVRQHPFNEVAAARGWRHAPRLSVGDDARRPPTKPLPALGLRAEYWVWGVREASARASHTFALLATDQVRFYRAEAAANSEAGGWSGYTSDATGAGAGGVNEPVPLDQVPPLALSEVLRDVDLFVGVASVGNDPTWQDGGGDVRFRTYWHDYGFGPLAETARTRREALARMVPRLTIADRCTLTERFLIVRGQLRTYKIHLGSGNVLMEPNDQYLCIVPDRSADRWAHGVYRPFDGDDMLTVILSKAFLLAADERITDPTITRQIHGR